jgi:hypothetical protein
MQGVLHRFHGHAHAAPLQPASTLLPTIVMILVILAILVLMLGVLVPRAV